MIISCAIIIIIITVAGWCVIEEKTKYVEEEGKFALGINYIMLNCSCVMSVDTFDLQPQYTYASNKCI